MRMKRPQGYKHIKCPHCGVKIRVVFRTMHRLKLEVQKPEGAWDYDMKDGEGPDVAVNPQKWGKEKIAEILKDEEGD